MKYDYCFNEALNHIILSHFLIKKIIIFFSAEILSSQELPFQIICLTPKNECQVDKPRQRVLHTFRKLFGLSVRHSKNKQNKTKDSH